MVDIDSYFKGKKITVAGLGLLGRGVGDVEFLATRGAELIVTDLKTEAELTPSLERLTNFPDVTFVLGEHREEDFKGRDFILKGPTVPFDSSWILAAKKEGTPIKMSASWFAELANVPIVGVTGTRGKTTTTCMLYDVMKAADMNVLLGGNIRGVSTLSLLSKVRRDSIALIELDSWQCEGFGETGISPNVAVFTSFMPDHMDYYQGDMDRYLHAKAHIFLNQKPSDVLIASSQVALLLKEKYGSKIRSQFSIAKPKNFPNEWHLPLLGEHNKLNAECAVGAARALGIEHDVIRKAIEHFKTVPGRLELVRKLNDVTFYNDTTSTTPEATIAALKALDTGDKNIVLIMGGADKGLAMDELLKEIEKTCKATVLLAGTGTENIITAYRLNVDTEPYTDLRLAVEGARTVTEPGDIVLLSPGFASFGMFKNEFDRGDQFNEIVNNL